MTGTTAHTMIGDPLMQHISLGGKVGIVAQVAFAVQEHRGHVKGEQLLDQVPCCCWLAATGISPVRFSSSDIC